MTKHRFFYLFFFAFIPSAFLLAETDNAWQRRAELEEKWRSEGMVLIPHNMNYFLPYTYNTSPHPTSVNREQYQEAKFQISFKVLLWKNIWNQKSHLYFGYTQLAFWQVYDQNRSAPFRDINYEPEVILALDTNREFGGFTLRQVDLAVDHQSNGTSPPDSRTWNRLYAKFFFDRENFLFTVKPWLNLHDSQSQEDNPDIDRYMGYGEITVSYTRKNHILSMLLRNNLEAQNRGAIELNYSFPLTQNLTGLLQYFSGYGESLVDYNRSNNRYGIGIALSDWH